MTRPAEDSHIPRKIFHALAGSVIPAVYYIDVLPAPVVVWGVAAVAGVWISFDTARLYSPALNAFFGRRFSALMKKKEMSSYTGATHMLAGAVIAMILFSQPVAVTVLFFISLGDPAAAIVGRSVGRTRIYRGRTLEGSAAMFAVCLPLGYYFAGAGWPVASVAALVAALTELYAGPVDDNLTVPIFSGAALMSLS
ncbi:MAG: diacylglycerol/polyprenol kinase family protein [Candidatus Nitrospinota bacterium M3_3B_026]